jgi:hypothetical protein
MKHLLITLLGTALVLALVGHARGLSRWDVWSDDWDD